MNPTEHHDRLIDTLLAESLGSERAPDLAGRITTRIAHERWRARRGLLSAAAAAAVLVGAALMLAGRYPQPCVTGSGGKPDRAVLGRGTIVRTGTETVDLVLGGYCRLRIGPGSEVEVGGRKREESVVLRKGGMTCEVNRRKGTFKVITRAGTISVTGTRFNVKLIESNGSSGSIGNEKGTGMRTTTEKIATALAVAVLTGTVSVQHNGDTWSLSAGGSSALAAEQGKPAVQADGGKIEAGKPSYRAKDNEAWKEKGRIVGMVRNAPAFVAKVLDAKGDVVKTFKADKNARAYELEWLAPGTYTLEVSAEGYKTLTVKGLEVKAGNDLFVGVEFTPTL